MIVAKIEFERALKCKKCGKLHTTFNRFNHCLLCQGCGTHLMDYLGNREAEVTENADVVTVKITHKLFSNIIEEVSI